MRVRWHPLVETGDDFLEAAPFRYVYTVDRSVPPESIWAALTADNTLVSWSPLVTGLRWTTPRPFGVGTTREVTMLRLLTKRERYYRWDSGRRKTSPRSRHPSQGCVDWLRTMWWSARQVGRASSGRSSSNQARY